MFQFSEEAGDGAGWMYLSAVAAFGVIFAVAAVVGFGTVHADSSFRSAPFGAMPPFLALEAPPCTGDELPYSQTTPANGYKFRNCEGIEGKDEYSVRFFGIAHSVHFYYF